MLGLSQNRSDHSRFKLASAAADTSRFRPAHLKRKRATTEPASGFKAHNSIYPVLNLHVAGLSDRL